MARNNPTNDLGVTDPLNYFKPSVIPSPPDERDYPAAPPRLAPQAFPSSHVLPRGDVENQEDRGSCCPFTGCRMYERVMKDHQNVDIQFSVEHSYAHLRAEMNMLCQDPGSWPAKMMEMLKNRGVPLESQVPYKSRDLCWRPGQADYDMAQSNKIERYGRLMTPGGQARIDELKSVLFGTNGRGNRVSACFTLTQTFNGVSTSTGLMPRPDPSRWWGGHMMDWEGWDDRYHGGGFWMENQWWKTFGLDGHVFVPYDVFVIPQSQGGPWLEDMWSVFVPTRVEPEPEPDPVPVTRVYDVEEIWDWPPGATDYRVRVGNLPTIERASWKITKRFKEVEGQGPQMETLTEFVQVKKPTLQ